MSKTAQRRESFFKLGSEDAVAGLKPRYKRSNRHGLGAYRAGFNVGKQYLKLRNIKSFLDRFRK